MKYKNKCKCLSIVIIIFLSLSGSQVLQSQIPYNTNLQNQIYIYSPLPDWIAAGGGFGCGVTINTISNAGDNNNDGYDDIIIGNCAYGGYSNGCAFAFYGSQNGLNPTVNWFISGGNFTALGSSTSSAGDVNGDGYDDVLVGGGLGGDYVNLYFGSPSGLSNSENWVVHKEANGGSESFGYGLACAGDINNDGYSDIIISDIAYRLNNNGNNIGKLYVYYGHNYGLNNTPDWTITGANFGVALGGSVSSAGDVNGDGYSDIIVGSYNFINPLHKIFVFNGGPGGLSNVPGWIDSSAGDVNGDGYSDVIVGRDLTGSGHRGEVKLYYGSASGINSNAIWTITGDSVSDNLGSRISTAGDVNADGYSDIILNQNRGHSKLFFGSPNGIDSVNHWSLNPGYEVSGAGDVNNDGFDDVIVGNYNYIFSYYGIPQVKKLILNLFIQGFYNKFLHTMIQDTVKVYLRKAQSPYSIFDSSKTIVNTNGTGSFSLLHTAKNLNFYMQLKHRNSLETWSSVLMNFEDTLITYDFSNDITNAYGNNMIQIENSRQRFGIYSGDINQDRIIDASDLSAVDNDAAIILSGYVKTDVTGDNFVDASDISIVENNVGLGVAAIVP